MEGETPRRLSELTDQGAFERLATAVLREADPRYVALSHPGVNAAGKTVKAPLDGIAFVPGANPPHLVAAHHTTTKLPLLANKWLHDPQKVKPRKGKPTAPAGDIIKTAGIVADERKREPATLATLALTTNIEPSQDAVRDAHALARNFDIELDIWSRSRIAHFLDSPPGQWLRHALLGIQQERISKDLLAELSRKSLQQFAPPGDDPSAWVERAIDTSLSLARGQATFVIADPGLGKSVACYKFLSRHVERGGYGLIIPHELVEQALTAAQAIDLALRQLHPQLAPDAGADALLLCEAALPLLVVVEDINRSGRPSELVERIAGWNMNDTGKSDAPSRWRLFCPAWPQALHGLKDQIRKRIEQSVLTCSLMTPAEGRLAVQQRGVMQGHSISAMDSDAIATALGHDPLLIALHDVREKPDPHSVIVRFIDACIGRTATANQTYTATDYRMALLALAQQMLSRRNIDPRWADVLSWFGSSGDVLPALRALTAQGEVIRIAVNTGDDRLAFRHDRVRDSLLTTALAERVGDGTLSDDLLSDPFFAEMVGSILASNDSSASFLTDVVRANPLALFYGLARVQSFEKSNAIAEAITAWLKSSAGQSQSYDHLRWHAQRVLSRIESPHVREIVAHFKRQGWDGWAARFRNGDLAGGLELGRRLDAGTTDPWRDRLMEHVKLRFGLGLVKTVGQYLTRTDLPADARMAALRIAAHLADTHLADAIASSWEIDDNRLSHLADYLVAAAYCCEDNAARLLAPICDAWAALPSKSKKENYPSAREDLAAHGVRFAFRHCPPKAALPYFIERAKTEELNWPITYMLHEVDEPDSIEFIARERASTSRRLEGSGRISLFLSSISDRWSRAGEDGGVPMSQASKDRLLNLWNSTESDSHLKEQAFRLWAATLRDGDLDILKRVDPTDKLWDKALYARLVRGDHTAIPFLEEKLRTKDQLYWWQAGRYIWSDRLTAALDQSFVRRGAQVERSWKQKYTDVDWMTSEMVMRLPIGIAEALLLKHWDHLRYAPNFIHAALHTATKPLLERVQATMTECPDPKEAMKYIDQHYGLKQKGRPTARLAQVEALVPFLDLMDEHTIDRFADVCNEHGWVDFRRKYLDPQLTDPRLAEFKDEENIFRSLDEFVAKDRIYNIDWWLDRFKRSGATADEIIQYLGQWLSSRKSMDALRVVAEAVAQIGRRRDLSILTIGEIEPTDQTSELLADTEFSVKRRTLH